MYDSLGRILFSRSFDLMDSRTTLNSEELSMGMNLNMEAKLDTGAFSVFLTSETNALIKAEGTQSRIPWFHLLSKRIVSLDEARRKSA